MAGPHGERTKFLIQRTTFPVQPIMASSMGTPSWSSSSGSGGSIGIETGLFPRNALGNRRPGRPRRDEFYESYSEECISHHRTRVARPSGEALPANAPTQDIR